MCGTDLSRRVSGLGLLSCGIRQKEPENATAVWPSFVLDNRLASMGGRIWRRFGCGVVRMLVREGAFRSCGQGIHVEGETGRGALDVSPETAMP